MIPSAHADGTDPVATARGTDTHSLTVGLLPLLTFAVATIPAKITPTSMLQLPVAFGAGADHCGHDGANYGLRGDG